MKRILISGYIGFNNFGDEAIFSALLNHLKEKKCKISVLCNKENASYDVKMYDYKRFKDIFWAIFTCSVLISGGGSLLQNKTSNKSLLYYLFIIFLAKLMFKKVIIFAQGIEPIKGNIYQKLTRKILKSVNFITVRDNKSLELLKDWKINANLVSDPIYSLIQDRKINENKEGLIVQLRDFSGLKESFLNNLAKVVAKNYEGDIKILSLQDEYDKIPCLYFKEQLKKLNRESEFVHSKKPDEIIDILDNSKYVISTRLHGLIAANALGSKTFALKYDEKINTLTDELNIQNIDLFNYTDVEVQEKLDKFFSDDEYNTNPYRRFSWDLIDEKLKLKDK